MKKKSNKKIYIYLFNETYSNDPQFILCTSDFLTMYRKFLYITKKHKRICVRSFMEETNMDVWNGFLFLVLLVFDYLGIDCSCFIVNKIVVQFVFSL